MTDYSISAAETRGKMILAGRAYLLADQTKFTRRTPFRVPNMDKCAGVIVDRDARRGTRLRLESDRLGYRSGEIEVVFCGNLLI